VKDQRNIVHSTEAYFKEPLDAYQTCNWSATIRGTEANPDHLG
jgi:hypothetical protein